MKDDNQIAKEVREEGLKTGRAIDAYAEPDKVRQIVEDEVGYMKDGFENFDRAIDELVDVFRKKGVCFYNDIELSLFRFQMKNLPAYLRNLLSKFRDELAITNKTHKCISGNNGKCIECGK